MTFLSRTKLLDWLSAKFPQASLANPTNSDIQQALTNVVDSAQSAEQTSITATADGLTTGLIAAGKTWANVTSGNSAHLVTLPAIADVTPGYRIRGYVGANGFKFVTPASSNEKINNVDSDGSAAAAVPANSMFEVTMVDATQGWVLMDFTRLGAVTAAITPA